MRPEPNHAYAVDGSAFPAIWEAFKAALAEPIQDAEWDVVSVHAGLQGPYGRHDPGVQVHALEFTRLADAGAGLVGVILVAEWTPSGAAVCVDARAGAAGASEPDETSIPLEDWIAAVEASEAFRMAARARTHRVRGGGNRRLGCQAPDPAALSSRDARLPSLLPRRSCEPVI